MGEANNLQYLKGMWTGNWIGKAEEDISLLKANGISVYLFSQSRNGAHNQ